MRVAGFIVSALLIGMMVVITVNSTLEKTGIEEDETLEKIKNPLVVGKGIERGKVPSDFQLSTISGDVIKLSDLKGKKIILNFWASWCPPCQAEMPDMESYYRKYKDKANVEILAVNMTKTERLGISSIEKFVDDYGLTFPVLLDLEGEIMRQYGLLAFPTTLIIETEGTIAHIIPKQIDEKLLSKLIDELDE